jgi:outer membrane protein OmpA-like peptidoglycan-associated protein
MIRRFEGRKVMGAGLLALATAALVACSDPPPPQPPPQPPPPPATATPPPPPPPPVETTPPPPPPPPPPVVIVKRIELEEGRFKLNEELLFKTGSFELDPKSADFAAYIAFTLNEHRRVDFIEIAGHADKRGSEADNVKLTQKRADEVVRILIEHGVDPHRIRGVGYGAYCPIDPADNDAAYAKNRRVEFRILRSHGVDTKWKWDGCDAAAAKGMKPIPIPKDAPKSKPHKGGKLVIVRKGVELIFPDEVHFEPGSATLHADAAPVLESLKFFLEKDKGVEKIRIEGHTDSPQNTPDMVALSKARSKAVVEWLANHGINPGRLLPVGCGSNRPIRGKDGKIDHARTKRTEAHVILEKGKPLGAPVPADCSAD